MRTVEQRIGLAEKRLGLRFKKREILRQALTHRSFSAEAGTRVMNEKLEFLGDAVLSVIITEHILRRHPELREGDLAKLRANLVKEAMLAKVARRIGLGDTILMGKGAELTGGRERASILGDTLEAVIGALFLDRGITATKAFVLGTMKAEIAEQAAAAHYGDPKTRLQEYLVARYATVPQYRVLEEYGPVHDRTFVVEVAIDRRNLACAEGKSKKKAQLAAAAMALEALEAREKAPRRRSPRGAQSAP